MRDRAFKTSVIVLLAGILAALLFIAAQSHNPTRPGLEELQAIKFESTQNSRIAAATANVSTFDGELEKYKQDIGGYPSSDQGLNALMTDMLQNGKWNGPYIRGVLPNDPWGHPYIYTYPGIHGRDFDVSSSGPDGMSGTDDDIGNWNLQR